MVMLGEGGEKEAAELMAVGPESSKPLHNFTMPRLKWGNQKFLRCMKVNSHGEFSAGVYRRSLGSEVDRDLIGRRRESFKVFSPAAVEVGGLRRKSKEESDGDDGIEAVREKLMFDLQTAANKMKDAILRERLEEDRPATAAANSPPPETVRPWNLRTRRAACKAPNGINGGGSGSVNGGGGNKIDGGGNDGGGKRFQVDVLKPNFSPLRNQSKSLRFGGSTVADTALPSGEKREREKFSVSLSRREIEEDFMAMAGHRPPRRPKKRAKIVQKQLDTLFPGLWLTEVTADFYTVDDALETRKR